MNVTQKIKMDLLAKQNIQTIHAVRDDTNSRLIEISLFEGGIPWAVPVNSNIAIAYLSANGANGIYDTLPSGEDAYIYDDNKISIILVPAALYPGITKISVVISDESGNQISTFPLSIDVDENYSYGASEPENYVNLRQWMSAELVTLLEEMGAIGTVWVKVTQGSDLAYSANKTCAELMAAHENGQELQCRMVSGWGSSENEDTELILSLVSVSGDGVKFQCTVGQHRHLVVITAADEVSYSYAVIANQSDVPEGESATLYVTITEAEDGALAASATDEEIAAALAANRTVVAVMDGLYFSLIGYDGAHLFSLNVADSVRVLTVVGGKALYEEHQLATPDQIPTQLPNPHTLTINGQTYNGSAMVDVRTPGGTSVKAYGAKGDGATDDTAAFRTALATNRTVFVPGGTYVLSGTLVIRENCCLELSQDTVLQFTQTEGNCVEMRGSATLRGNHAVISAAYGLTGNVISMDTSQDGADHASIPPYAKSDPMFKRQRFVYDVNIIKPNDAGFNRSEDGVCNGTAIYMHCDGLASISWMWGVSVIGVRIAGGFSYGIHAINADDPDGYTDNAWNHDMRIEAVIEACEVGVALENCNGAHLNVTVQPCQAVDNTAYAKWGVYLNDCRFVDMLRSRVWDWNADNTLWTEGGEHQHIALVGNCRGLLLDDFLCHEVSTDIRSLIYTDTDSNYDTMTILQEPGNKWFKSVDGTPYFNDGTANRRLRLSSEKITAEQAEFIQPADGYYTYAPNFSNLASNCRDGYCLDTAGADMSLAGYAVTDYIPIDGGNSHVYRIGGEGISWSDSYGYCRIAWYDADKKLKGSVMSWDKIGSSIYYPVKVEDDTVAAAFSTNANVAAPNGAAYFRVSVMGAAANIAITIDEEQSYTAIWHGEPKRLDESIYAQNAYLTSAGGKQYKLVVDDDGTLSTEEIT